MESYSLGFDNPIALSAEHGEGVVDLFDALRPIVEGHDAEGADALAPIEGEDDEDAPLGPRSEEHTSELQSLMRISYAVFCLKKKNKRTHKLNTNSKQIKKISHGVLPISQTLT